MNTPEATFYYGARAKRDLCFEEELRGLSESLPNFTYVPALSEPRDDEDWDGEVGLITDVVRQHETDLAAADAYVCGPPPMVEAAHRDAQRTWGVREDHLLRQVHHHRGTHMTSESRRT